MFFGNNPSLYIVSYQLNKPGQNYAGLIAALNAYKADAYRIMQSVWLVIDQDNGAQELYNYLVRHIDPENDWLWVSEVTGNYQAKLDPKAQKWLAGTLKVL